MYFKKALSLVLAVVMLCGIVAVGVSADHSGSVDNTELECPIDLSAEDKKELYQKIYDGIFNMDEKVDVSEFGFSYNQKAVDYLTGFLKYTKESSPELFCEFLTNEENKYSFSFEILDNNITNIILPEFTDHSKENFHNEYKEFISLADDIIAEIPKSFTELEKILYVHNYLDLHFEYDTSNQIRDAYNFLKTGKGVCQAYTYLFSFLMKRLGIECTEANDNSDSHTWNIVKLDGEWYHIDCTHDDPLNQCNEDVFGHASYSHFLLSDEKILSVNSPNNHHKEHYSPLTKLFGTEIYAESTKYESQDYVWNKADSNLSYCNGEWYFMDYNEESEISTLYKTNDFIAVSSTGKTIEDKWFVYEEDGTQTRSYYPCYFGSLFAYGNEICYSAPQKIYALNTVTNTERELVTVGGMNVNKNIYGCTYDRIKGIKICDKNEFVDTNNFATFTLSSHILSDGEVKAAELIKVKKYLLGMSDENPAKYDVCKSVGVTIHDLAELKKISAGIE